MCSKYYSSLRAHVAAAGTIPPLGIERQQLVSLSIELSFKYSTLLYSYTQ